MTRKILAGTFILCVVAMFVGTETAHAEYLGRFCWRLDPLRDQVMVDVVQNGLYFFLLYGIWTGENFSMAVSGSAALDWVGSGNDFYLAGADLVDTPGPNRILFLHAKITSGLNGTWRLKRDDGTTASGTFTSVPLWQCVG